MSQLTFVVIFLTHNFNAQKLRWKKTRANLLNHGGVTVEDINQTDSFFTRMSFSDGVPTSAFGASAS